MKKIPLPKINLGAVPRPRLPAASTLRRLAIGVVLGLVIVGILSFVMDDKKAVIPETSSSIDQHHDQTPTDAPHETDEHDKEEALKDEEEETSEADAHGHGTDHDDMITETVTSPALDEEIIVLREPEPEPQPDPEEEKTPQETHLAAGDYYFFDKHKATLKDKQRQAISENKPRISIIINAVGQQKSIVDKIVDMMPQDVTIALSPYARTHNETAKKFNDYGFETWMDLAALQRHTETDFGNDALNPANDLAFNINLLTRQLADKDHITGLILPPHALITQAPRLWSELVYEIFADGYGLLDNSGGITKPAFYFHEDKRAPYIEGDITLDNPMTIDQFKSALNNIRKETIDQKALTLSLPAYTPATLDILAEWINSLEDEGITLVPLSAQAKL